MTMPAPLAKRLRGQALPRRAGAHVRAADRDWEDPTLEIVSQTVLKKYCSLGDIGDPDTAARIVDTAVSRFGGVDVLINNAGFLVAKPFTDYTPQDFEAMVSTTLAGFFYVSQLTIKQMVRQKSGSVINVSTAFVDQPIVGVGAVVIMLKGALNAVTRALALEYANDGIRVNTIAPGPIDSPMHKPEAHDFLKGLHPVGRIGEVKEVVDAALFLADATFTSGEILHVDGSAHLKKW